jgi:hypothetical protein
MNPEVKESQYSEVSPPSFTGGTESSASGINGGEAPILPLTSKSTSQSSQYTAQARQTWNLIVGYVSDLPDYLSEFFASYKQPLIVIGLVFGSIISVKLTLAILDAVNDIPLLAPTFELIGFAYTAWFIYRYLRTATGRDELTGKFNTVKDEVVGGKNPLKP